MDKKFKSKKQPDQAEPQYGYAQTHPNLCLSLISNLRVVGKFKYHSIFKSIFCKQTVQNLTRRRILRSLVWFFTVCRCPIKRTLCLYIVRVKYV